MLIKTIILNNSRVCKLNTLRRMRRSEPDETSTVSDDEEESPVPTLGTFMNIPSALRNLATDNPTLGLTLPTRVPVQDVSLVDVVLNPTNSDLDGGAPGNLGWCQLISAGNEPAAPTDQHFKNSHVNYQSLGPIYGTEDVANNSLLLDMMDIPNAILQMVYNKLYVPLSMLTTSTLSKIQMTTTSNSTKFLSAMVSASSHWMNPPSLWKIRSPKLTSFKPIEIGSWSSTSLQPPMWPLAGTNTTPECLGMKNSMHSLTHGGIWTSNCVVNLLPVHSKLIHIVPPTFNY